MWEKAEGTLSPTQLSEGWAEPGGERPRGPQVPPAFHQASLWLRTKEQLQGARLTL